MRFFRISSENSNRSRQRIPHCTRTEKGGGNNNYSADNHLYSPQPCYRSLPFSSHTAEKTLIHSGNSRCRDHGGSAAGVCEASVGNLRASSRHRAPLSEPGGRVPARMTANRRPEISRKRSSTPAGNPMSPETASARSFTAAVDFLAIFPAPCYT